MRGEGEVMESQRDGSVDGSEWKGLVRDDASGFSGRQSG